MVDADVQLVCKYLRAYKRKAEHDGINKFCIEDSKGNVLSKVKFSEDTDLSEAECHDLLKDYMPKHVVPTKITQQLYIR